MVFGLILFPSPYFFTMIQLRNTHHALHVLDASDLLGRQQSHTATEPDRLQWSVDWRQVEAQKYSWP